MAEFTSLNGYQVKDTVARSIAKGRNQAVAFTDYATMIEALNEYEKDEYKAGQNVYIGVVGVPDLWVYSVEDIRHTFIYESDDDIVDKLKNYTTIQVGFFKLAMLEGQKVDLTTYDQKITELTTNLGGLKFGIDENGDYGYIKEGADTVTPFKKDPYLKLVSTARSFNISSVVGEKNIGKYTKNDFIVCNTTASSGEGKLSTHNQGVTTACCATASYTKLSDPVVSYNASTGAVSISGGTYRTYAYLKKYNGSQYVTHGNPEPTDYNMSIAVYLMVKT